MILSVLLVTVPLIFLGVASYRSIKAQTFERIEKNLKQQVSGLAENVENVYNIAEHKVASDLNVARHIFYNVGNPTLDTADTMDIAATNQITKITEEITIPTMKIDDQQMAYNYEIVDKIKEMVGGTATIFQVIPDGLLRISTNVMKKDDTRAVGTYIPTDSPVYKTIMSGDTFYGRAYVVNAWYITAYEPILDETNEIIGALYVGVKEDYFQESLKNSFSQIVIGETGYIYILNKKGEYVLSYKRQRDGENIWDAKDTEGNYFIQEIVKNAEAGETKIIYYPWKNPGDDEARMKIASYTYFPEWEWIIAASAYHEEFLKGLDKIRNLTIIISLSFIVVGIIVAYGFINFTTNILSALIVPMQQIADGDLTISMEDFDAKNKESDQIINGFSNMVENLKQIIRKIALVTQDISSNSEELAASVQEVNSSTDAMNHSVQEITQHTVDANDTARNASDSAESANRKMERINEKVNSSVDLVETLNEKIDTINEMTNTIDNIATQTNLLALNAAIEAVRAGEKGKGFGVVAAEIRKLSEEAQNSTQEIRKINQDIINSVKDVLDSMKSNSEELQRGKGVIEEALSSLNDISDKISDVTAQIKSISGGTGTASRASIDQISSSMDEVSTIAENLASTAQDLSQAIDAFRM